MDNKVTKKRINDHLEYDWYKYLLIVLVAVVVGYFIFSQINSDKDYETIDFFISAYAQSSNNFEGEVMKEMNAPEWTESKDGGSSKAQKYGENVLRKISFNVRSPLDKEYGSLLQTQGTQSSDVLILGKRYIEGIGGFVPLTDELLNEYLLPAGLSIDDLQYCTYENSKGETIRNGIRVDTFRRMSGTGGVFEMDWRNTGYNDAYKDKPEEERPDTEFYLVLNPRSVSIGKFGSKAKDENAQALYCVNRFIQYYR